jgi:hypothetical protein
VGVLVRVLVAVGVMLGVFVAVGVIVGVFVAVLVRVGVLLGVMVGVLVRVGVLLGVLVRVGVTVGGGVSDVMDRHHPTILPLSPGKSSTTYKDHVPLGSVPLKVDNATLNNCAGAGGGKLS